MCRPRSLVRMAAPWCAWCRGSCARCRRPRSCPARYAGLNTRWDGCQEQPCGEPADQLPGGQRRDKPPSVRGGELPHRLYGVGQRGCAAAGWRPASGLGRRRRRRPRPAAARPAAARPAAWRHVASRAPQRHGASRAGELAGRRHIHRPAEAKPTSTVSSKIRPPIMRGPDRWAARERGRRWPVSRPGDAAIKLGQRGQ